MMTMLSVSPSELFPSIVWSTVAGTSVSTLSCPPSISVDVRRADSDCDSEPEVYWNLILDQTTLNIGFDIECLDGLDNTLLLSPNDAFAALCWDTIPQTPLPRPLIPKSPAASAHKSPLSIISEASIASKSSIKFPRHRPAPLTITSGTSSGEEGYESDSDDLRTLGDEATSLSSPLPSPFPSPLPSPYGTGFHLNHQPTVEPITLIKYSCLPYEIDEIDASFILFEPQHTIHYYCEDGLAVSNFNEDQRKPTKVNRIAAFCANLPIRLLRASS